MKTLVELAPLNDRTLQRIPDASAPTFCPICGRVLVYTFWDTVDDDHRYHAFVCFGDSRFAWFWIRVRTVWPSHVHYRYQWGPTRIEVPIRYDRNSGEPLT